MKQTPRYKYYADWDGGSIIANSLKDLCDQINTKFSYLNTNILGVKKTGITKDDFTLHNIVNVDAGYHLRNTFGRKFKAVYVNLLNSDAYCMGYDHYLKISRFKL